MFNNMKVGVRLGLMSGLLVLLTLVISYIAFSKTASIDSEWREYQQVTLEKRIATTNSYIAFGEAIHAFKDYVLRGRDYDKQFMTKMDEVDAGINAYRATGKVTAEEETSLKELLDALKVYRDEMSGLVAMRAANNDVEIAKLDKSVAGDDKPIGAALKNLFKTISLADEAKSTVVSGLIQTAQRWIIVVSIIAVLLSVPLAFWITRSITKPLGIAMKVANQLAEGDLTARIEVTSKDETGILLGSMQNMVDKLSSIIAEVRGAADNLSSASEEVSATAQSMSQASSEQAASVEETSASIEQMSASINQNTENAKITDGMAAKAAKEAAEGGEAVKQTVTAMQQIAEKDRHHRRHRLSDQPAGLERCHRGGPRRRTRQGLRGGGSRGEQARRAQPGGGAGDRRGGFKQRGTGGTGRQAAGRNGAFHQQDFRPGAGNNRSIGRTIFKA